MDPRLPMSTKPSLYAPLHTVTTHKTALTVTWQDGKHSTFHYLWLRDNCTTAFHPTTHERQFDLLEISPHIHPLSAQIDNDQLLIHWSEQEHTSHYTNQWLGDKAYTGTIKPETPHTAHHWDATFVERMIARPYATLMQSDQALYQWMVDLERDGLIKVTDMPNDAQSLTQIAQRIDYQRQTNFGITFEVKSVPDPINLAYTALALPLHTDLPNQETPPGYQFLHCLANNSTGGASLFADGFRVLEDMRQESPESFSLLARYPIPFRFHDDAHDILHYHPVINLDHQGAIVEIKYNAHIADTFDVPEDVMHDYYLAYRALMQRLQQEKYRIRIKLKAGEMVVFDNRRLLHGREAFDPQTGERHLRGCYVDRTEFKSRLCVLAKQWGNQQSE